MKRGSELAEKLGTKRAVGIESAEKEKVIRISASGGREARDVKPVLDDRDAFGRDAIAFCKIKAQILADSNGLVAPDRETAAQRIELEASVSGAN